ncbi:MAG TPA: hypothetical protein VEH05_11415 [Streptosporangiaceae bacterium]|nr:hypothetical protein [Streptosporangiaceae bacterium]
MASQSASTAQSATTAQSAGTAAEAASAISARPPRSITKRWLFAAFLLAGAAQLITISALLSADPLAASWSALLLAIAPVLLTAAAAFTPPRLARPAAVAAAVVLIVGIVGSLTDWSANSAHIGPLFIPALAAVLVGGFRLWQANTR